MGGATWQTSGYGRDAELHGSASRSFTPADITGWIEVKRQNHELVSFETLQEKFRTALNALGGSEELKKRWNSLMILPNCGSPTSSTPGKGKPAVISPAMVRDAYLHHLIMPGVTSECCLLVDFRNGKVLAFLGGVLEEGAVVFE